MLGVFKTQFIGHFTNGFINVQHFFFGNIHQLILDTFLCRFAGFFFNKVAKIIGGYIQLGCTIGHRGQAGFCRLFGIKILLQYWRS